MIPARGRSALALAALTALVGCDRLTGAGADPGAPAGGAPPAAGVAVADPPARPLEVRVLSPLPDARLAGPHVAVQVATTADVRSVKIGGEPGLAVAAAGQRVFQATLRNRPEGPQTIDVEATGLDDAVVKTSVAVTMDQTPPALAIEVPEHGAITSAEAVEVRGTVTEAGPVHVRVNEQPVAVDAEGRFAHRVALQGDRPTEVVVLARDAAGNLDRVRRVVQRDANAPVLTVVTPGDGGTVGGLVVEIEGTVDDPAATVTVNGERAMVREGRWSARLPLPEGTHEVTATARDASGQAATVKRRFTVDRTPPKVTLEAPAGDLITAADRVRVAGRVDDPAIATLRVGSHGVDVAGGRFQAEIPLVEGTNDCTVVVVDGAGNRDRVPLTVVRDSRGPALRIVQPLDGDVVTDPSLEIRGRAGEPLASITLNGAPLALADDGTFRGAAVLDEGANELVVTAVDRAGNQSQRRLRVTRRRAIEMQAPGFLLVPSGTFTMGRNDGTRDEGPEHDVHLAAYYLAPTEVTNAEYRRFVEWIATEKAEGRDPHRFCHPDEPTAKPHVAQFATDAQRGAADRPVVGVDWYDAYAYARWSGGRLPSEAEWERAAGWDAARHRRRAFPWGDTFRAAAAALDHLAEAARPVGSVPTDKSPVGALDMGGNVQEWTAEWFRGSYAPDERPRSRRATEVYAPRYRVVRGASWRRADPVAAAVTYRMIEDPRTRRDDLGFRVCRTP